jgi:uncharacterized protein YjbI with pentapeptide repeats
VRNVFCRLVARFRAELSFHFLVDVTTLIASAATVITLLILLQDRRDQANIAAWTLLQTYLEDGHPPQFNEGQGFALHTLARNGVPVDHLNGHSLYVEHADMSEVEARDAILTGAQFFDVTLSDAEFEGTDLSGATIQQCQCNGIKAAHANLSGAKLLEGSYKEADFEGADVSDVVISDVTADPQMFATACYAAGHPPSLSRTVHTLTIPADPPSVDCMKIWQTTWHNRYGSPPPR